MSCSQATNWLQHYIDGRLDVSRLVHLERHLRTCNACRDDLALFELLRASLAEDERATAAPDLTPLIMQRIAVHEIQRAAARVTPAWHDRRWQVAALTIALGIALVLFNPGLTANLTGTLNHGFPGVVAALTAPGPESAPWGVWLAGAIAVVILLLRFTRADAYTSWRRALAERLPQLW